MGLSKSCVYVSKGMCLKQARDRLSMGYVFKTSDGQTVEWDMCITSDRQTVEWDMCITSEGQTVNGVCV